MLPCAPKQEWQFSHLSPGLPVDNMATPGPAQGPEFSEDMLQMALRMASEMPDEPVLDLEDQLNPTPIQPGKGTNCMLITTTGCCLLTGHTRKQGAPPLLIIVVICPRQDMLKKIILNFVFRASYSEIGFSNKLLKCIVSCL